MNKKEVNNDSSKLQTIFTTNNDTYSNILEFDNFEDILKQNNNENNINLLKSTENPYKGNIREEKDILNKIAYNNKINYISNFNFFIIGQKQLEKGRNINHNEKQKKKDIKVNKKRGRKSERKEKFYNNNKDKDKKVHDKFSDDNLRKKCKNIILKGIFEFINKKLRDIYKENLGHGDLRKELKMTSQSDKIKSSIEFDKSFLDKNLKDIFSENVSKRLSNFSPMHNKILIESLMNEEDNEKRNFFINLFKITFGECLRYFREDPIDIKELKGYPKLSSIKNELIEKQGKEYANSLIYHLKHFEEIINNKKSRINKKDVLFNKNK